MSKKVTKQSKIDLDLEKILINLMKSPLRMQLIFYLLSFNELSLSQITELLNKPKTTLHHHLHVLETENIIQSREQITKNYRERYYKIVPHIMQIIKSEDKIKINIKGNQKQTILFLLKSFTAYISSLLDRLFNVVNQDAENTSDFLNEMYLHIHLVNKNQYHELLKKIKEINQEFTDTSEKTNIFTPSKDSYAIFNIFLPYGKLYPMLNEKIKMNNKSQSDTT